MIWDDTKARKLTTNRDGERGAALILALMVSLVLVFLGMGLLLQTSLGLQASGTDRWVTKALYAADAGAMMQIEMIQLGVFGTPGTFTLQDDPDISGLLKGQFSVTVEAFCMTQGDEPASTYEKGYSRKFFYLRSQAVRNVGDLAGLTRATVEVDVSAQPFTSDEFEAVPECF